MAGCIATGKEEDVGALVYISTRKKLTMKTGPSNHLLVVSTLGGTLLIHSHMSCPSSIIVIAHKPFPLFHARNTFTLSLHGFVGGARMGCT